MRIVIMALLAITGAVLGAGCAATPVRLTDSSTKAREALGQPAEAYAGKWHGEMGKEPVTLEVTLDDAAESVKIQGTWQSKDATQPERLLPMTGILIRVDEKDFWLVAPNLSALDGYGSWNAFLVPNPAVFVIRMEELPEGALRLELVSFVRDKKPINGGMKFETPERRVLASSDAYLISLLQKGYYELRPLATLTRAE